MCYVEFINIGALWIHHSAVIPIVPIGKQAAVLHGTGHYSLGCMALTPSPHPPLTLMQHCDQSQPVSAGHLEPAHSFIHTAGPKH